MYLVAAEEVVSVVICMELCDLGSLWTSVLKGVFRSTINASRFDHPPQAVGA